MSEPHRRRHRRRPVRWTSTSTGPWRSCSSAADPEPGGPHRRGDAVRRRPPRRPRAVVPADPARPLLVDLPGRSELGRPGPGGPRRHDRVHGAGAQGQRPAGAGPGRHLQRPLRRGRPGDGVRRGARPDLHRHGHAAEGQRARLRRRGRHPGRRLGPRRGPGRRAGQRPRRRWRRWASRSATSWPSTPPRSSPMPASWCPATSTARRAWPPPWPRCEALVERDVVLPHRPPAGDHRRGGRPGCQPRPRRGRGRAGLDRQRRRAPRARQSIEDGVTIPMEDLTGPFDYHLTRRLCRLCRDHDIPHARDVFRPLPLRRGRRPGGRGRHPGRPGRLRPRRQPRLGAHPRELHRGGGPAAHPVAPDPADLRPLGRPAHRRAWPTSRRTASPPPPSSGAASRTTSRRGLCAPVRPGWW